MRLRLRVGDVFEIPLGDGRSGIGQIVGKYLRASYYFAIFDLVVASDEVRDNVSAALQKSVTLLALSMDGKLYAGHWTVIDHAPVAPQVSLPAYKEAVGSPTTIEVVDFSGTKRRRATPVEAETLPNRTTVSPMVLEMALRAMVGLEPWQEGYDSLRTEGTITTADIFG